MRLQNIGIPYVFNYFVKDMTDNLNTLNFRLIKLWACYNHSYRATACNACMYCCRNCPSVRLSDASILTKRNNRLSISQHHTKQGYLYSLSIQTGVRIVPFHPKYSSKCDRPTRPRHQSGAHGGRAPAKITGLFMLKNRKKTNGNPMLWRLEQTAESHSLLSRLSRARPPT